MCLCVSKSDIQFIKYKGDFTNHMGGFGASEVRMGIFKKFFYVIVMKAVFHQIFKCRLSTSIKPCNLNRGSFKLLLEILLFQEGNKGRQK